VFTATSYGQKSETTARIGLIQSHVNFDLRANKKTSQSLTSVFLGNSLTYNLQPITF